MIYYGGMSMKQKDADQNENDGGSNYGILRC